MFVKRDDSGVIGAFANAQAGVAEEYLAEDDQELMAFLESLASFGKVK